jgi:hypothetical protein
MRRAVTPDLDHATLLSCHVRSTASPRSVTDLIRVYVNARPVDVPRDATVLDAVRAHDAATADLIVAGDRAIADSRGLPLPPESPTYMGAILRVISGRRRGDGAE